MPKPIKVVHVIPTLDQGGAEKQMCLLVSNLDRSQFEPHVVVLTHTGPREQELLARDVPVHHVGKRFKFDWWAYRRLKAILEKLRPDIVHTWLFAANCYGRVAARAAGVRSIVAGERCVDPWKSWWQIAIDRWLLKSTDAVVTNTSAITDFYRQRKLPIDRFVVIPNAVETPDCRRLTRQAVFERLQIPPRDRLILAVGRLWPQKGYRDLIWAAELIRIAYENVWLVIVGDGPERERLLHFRDQTGGADVVRFVGQRTDTLELLSGADALWNGSLYEGQSNTILEAMSLGVPVLASDIPGTRDLVEHERSGFLYPLGDAAALARLTNRLFSDDALSTSIGQAAHQRVAHHFSLSSMAQHHAELYQQLHEKGPGLASELLEPLQRRSADVHRP